MTASASAVRGRVIPLIIFLGASAVLALAGYLKADPTGVGTHQKLGLPPCGFYELTGVPCATCGMTTAFTHAAHGQMIQSAKTQPAGALFAILTAAAWVVSGWALVTGVSLMPLGRWLWGGRTTVALIVLILLSWVYKIIVIGRG